MACHYLGLECWWRQRLDCSYVSDHVVWLYLSEPSLKHYLSIMVKKMLWSSFFQKGPNPASFCLFPSFFSIQWQIYFKIIIILKNISKKYFKIWILKRRWCACDSSLGLKDFGAGAFWTPNIKYGCLPFSTNCLHHGAL